MSIDPRTLIGLLWLRDEDYVHRQIAFEFLKERRDLFSSQAAADALTGYAAAQLKQMQAFDLGRIAEYEAMPLPALHSGRERTAPGLASPGGT